MKILKKVAAIFDRTNNLLILLAAVLLVFIMLGVIVDVILRQVGFALVWMFEITEYCLLFITFLGAAWLLRREGHVRMDLVLDRLNPGIQSRLSIITSILGAITCLVIAWYSGRATLEYFQLGYTLNTELRPPQAPIMAIIPVGYFLLFIQFLRRAYGFLASMRELPDKRAKL